MLAARGPQRREGLTARSPKRREVPNCADGEIGDGLRVLSVIMPVVGHWSTIRRHRMAVAKSYHLTLRDPACEGESVASSAPDNSRR